MRVSQARGMDEREYPGSYKDRDVVGGEVDEEEYRCQSGVLYVTGNVGTQHLYPRNKPYPSGAGSLREFPRGYVSEDAASRMVRAPVRPRSSLDRDDPGGSCAGWHASAFCSGRRLTSDVRADLRISSPSGLGYRWTAAYLCRGLRGST